MRPRRRPGSSGSSWSSWLRCLTTAGLLFNTAVLATPIKFEDNPPSRLQEGDQRDPYTPRNIYAAGATPVSLPNGPASLPGAPPPLEDSQGRVLFLHKKKKKKKVICGLAGLLAGRDAGGGGGEGGSAEHRAARAVSEPQQAQQQEQGGDTRSYGGVGVAGFLLGTLVGTKLGYGFQQPHQQVPVVPAAPPLTQTQTQTQTSIEIPYSKEFPLRNPGRTATQTVQGVPAVPVVPVVPLVPAPVHEDYDEVEDDPLNDGGGGGGGNLCQQLQNRPDPGPLDSHFPLIHGLLLGQGGGQRPYYRPPPRPQYRPPPQQYYKPHQAFLYNYVKPWADLFFK